MKQRLFITIDFPKEIKQEIAGLVKKLSLEYPTIRWEKTENIHLTLKFLGYVEVNIKNQKLKIKNTNQKRRDFEKSLLLLAQNPRIEEITEGIKRSINGIKPFWFEPVHLGYFLRQSLIVWLGLKSQEGLFQIVKNLESEMANLGFPKEKREFSPHITIGRAKRATPRKKWQKIAQEIKNCPTSSFSKFKVSGITLMKSQLTPKGSIYSVVSKVLLKG